MYFSVIVPTFNRRDLLEQALETVWAQTFRDFEVIVVDDGSADETQAYLDTLGAKAKVLRQRNQGPSAARNAGAALACGTYLAFLDSDDLWFPWTLASIREAFAAYGDAAMLQANWLDFTGAAPATLPGHIKAQRYRDYLEAAGAGVYLAAGRIVMDRNAFLSIGGFDANLRCAEDHDLGLKGGVLPGFIQITEAFQVASRRHAHSASQNRQEAARGARLIIQREKAGGYPGGERRRRDRERVIARDVRPVSVACLRAGRAADAWRLFAATLAWSLGQRRWKYLLGFPGLALWLRLSGQSPRDVTSKGCPAT